MRWLGCVGTMLAVAACSSPNPAYEGTGTALDAGEGTDAGPTDAGPTGDPGQDTADDDSGQDGSASESGGATGDETPLPAEYCQADLYAINHLGELYLLDADTGETTLIIADPRLESWAIATEPESGEIYVSELADPTQLWRVQPFPAAVDPSPVTVTDNELASMARATFHPNGDLWLGTENTNRFVWFSPNGRNIGAHTVGGIGRGGVGRGGDILFLEPDCALVPTLEGQMYRVCFSDLEGQPPTTPVSGLPLGAQLTGIARDAMGRVWLSTTDVNRVLIHIEPNASGWTAVEADTVAYDITISDLAPVVQQWGC